jgi:hypothetical protein
MSHNTYVIFNCWIWNQELESKGYSDSPYQQGFPSPNYSLSYFLFSHGTNNSL